MIKYLIRKVIQRRLLIIHHVSYQFFCTSGIFNKRVLQISFKRNMFIHSVIINLEILLTE